MSDECEVKKSVCKMSCQHQPTPIKNTKVSPCLTSPSDGGIAINSKYSLTTCPLQRDFGYNSIAWSYVEFPNKAIPEFWLSSLGTVRRTSVTKQNIHDYLNGELNNNSRRYSSLRAGAWQQTASVNDYLVSLRLLVECPSRSLTSR